MAVDIGVYVSYLSDSALNSYIDLGEIAGSNWDTWEA